MQHVHVIGAGLAGLSAALALTEAGRAVTLYEAAPAAGGRCRSYFDRELGLTIDNGNHLLLSGNRATFEFLRAIGSTDRLGGPATALFPFVEAGTKLRWTVRPNAGRIPWWVLSPSRRVPDSRLGDYRGLLSLARCRDDRTVDAALRHGRLYWRLIEPLAIAALNTSPRHGLARLLGAVVRETLQRGGTACVPRFPRDGLAGALVDPAVELLRRRGATLHFTRRVAEFAIEGRLATALHTTDGSVALDGDAAVVLAVPPWVATALLPELTAPDAFEAILNIHFAFAWQDTGDPELSAIRDAGFVGVIGGTAEWVFVKRDHLSVTISAANRMVDWPPETIADAVWRDVSMALKLDAPLPAFRVLKERRATFAATAEQEKRRPGTVTPLVNVRLAGDWTATGLPATIEGAIRSGRRAAETLLSGAKPPR